MLVNFFDTVWPNQNETGMFFTYVSPIFVKLVELKLKPYLCWKIGFFWFLKKIYIFLLLKKNIFTTRNPSSDPDLGPSRNIFSQYETGYCCIHHRECLLTCPILISKKIPSPAQRFPQGMHTRLERRMWRMK